MELALNPLDTRRGGIVDTRTDDEWNPHVPHARGDLQEGESIEIIVDRIGEPRRTMTVRVSTVEPVKRLQWIGTIGTKWVFEGRHTFDLCSLTKIEPDSSTTNGYPDS